MSSQPPQHAGPQSIFMAGDLARTKLRCMTHITHTKHPGFLFIILNPISVLLFMRRRRAKINQRVFEEDPFWRARWRNLLANPNTASVAGTTAHVDQRTSAVRNLECELRFGIEAFGRPDGIDELRVRARRGRGCHAAFPAATAADTGAAARGVVLETGWAARAAAPAHGRRRTAPLPHSHLQRQPQPVRGFWACRRYCSRRWWWRCSVDVVGSKSRCREQRVSRRGRRRRTARHRPGASAFPSGKTESG